MVSNPALSSLLSAVTGFEITVTGDQSRPVSGVNWDYRKVLPGGLYVCLEEEEFQEAHIQGNARHHYKDALKYGADVFVVSEDASIDLPDNKTLVRVHGDLNAYMAYLCKYFHGDPFKDMTVIAVTGTKGKTTTCQILESIYSHLGYKTGYIGTIGVLMPAKSYAPGLLSNPTATDLFDFGRQMKDAGVQVLLMEVTSHGMHFRRNIALNFNTAVLTNLSTDHLDFHETREHYKNEKLKLFRSLGNNNCPAVAVINTDEADWIDVYNAIHTDRIKSGLVKAVTYGIRNKEADYTAYPEEMSGSGSSFNVYSHNEHTGKVKTPLPGLFNIYNSLSAFASADMGQYNREKIIAGILQSGSVKGRFEKVENPKNINIYIDYAHTADSLKNILAALLEIKSGKLICVFGCGGDRDRTKRPVMGQISAEMADDIWVTSDNPRTEDPEKIIHDIVQGIPDTYRHKLHIKTDRAEAITCALATAKENDTLLIAGKGHEQYQIIRKKKIFFSDREVVKKYFEGAPPVPMIGRGTLQISMGALRHNFDLIIKDMPDTLDFMAVVKDNANGVGMVKTAKTALNYGAVYLACSNMEEAMELRGNFQEAPIFIFGERADDELKHCVHQRFTLQMQSLETLHELNRVAAELNVKTKIHVKVDTGMSRYGLKPADVFEFYQAASAMPFIEIEGIMTHFAMSDETDKSFANRQLDVFTGTLNELGKTYQTPKYIHCCNTGGYLDLPQAHFNLVRLGILTTGIYPSKVCRRIHISGNILKPAISLISRVAFVKHLSPGDKVGYGMRFTATTAMTIAVIPIGYGDGYPRLRNTGRVIINGKSAPIIGGVSLDAMVVDITHNAGVKKNDRVTLIGKDGQEEISVMELADYAETVTYQIMINLNRRFNRHYADE